VREHVARHLGERRGGRIQRRRRPREAGRQGTTGEEHDRRAGADGIAPRQHDGNGGIHFGSTVASHQ
jgi:hypothetical protein